MSFTRLLLGPVFFRTALPCSGGYHLERGRMPLHQAIACQGAGVKYMQAKGCMFDDCARVI